MDEVDVVVVGAGVAGLAAARRLAFAGKRVRVVEARARIGGRIETHRGLGLQPVEAGAEFMHGTTPLTASLASEAGMLYAPIDGDSFLIRGQEALENGDAIGQLQQLLTRFRSEDIPAVALIDRWIGQGELTARHRDTYLRYVEGFNAADASRVSSRSLAEQERAAVLIHGDSPFRPIGGYDALPRQLAAALPEDTIRLREVVTQISWKSGTVRVRGVSPLGSPREEIAARAAVITLPLGVLKAGSVIFEPALPASHLGALAGLESGPVVKAVLKTTRELARRQVPGADVPLAAVGFLHGSGLLFPVWWPQRPLESNVFTGWAAGPDAGKLAALDDTELLEGAIRSLATLLRITPAALDAEVIGHLVTHWQRDPFARGAYSWAVVGAFDAPRQLAEPISGALFFAGEAANVEGQGGTVHGALASGERAAQLILQA
ncbi:MAG: FAD-dependent oxidoreductase [Deltaproteobacteria bacterium]|nr:FAD-dependent oxidoreductase [Deltaproteobacteria bacterium]